MGVSEVLLCPYRYLEYNFIKVNSKTWRIRRFGWSCQCLTRERCCDTRNIVHCQALHS